MIAAADIGGHTLTVGLVDGGVVRFKKTVPTPPSRTPRDICSEIESLLAGFGAASGVPLAVGVPGFVVDGVRVENCPNLCGWENVTADVLTDLTRRRAVLSNDCDLLALGEMSRGAARELDSFILMTLGTGVGGSVVINRRIVRGAHGRTGEVGHFPLLEDRGCGCGGRGHLECFFSAAALERAGERSGCGRDMRVLWENRENAWLARPFADALRALACVVSSLTCLLDPEAIVFGGGLSNLEGLFDDLRDYMFPLLPPAYRPGPPLLKAALGTDAPLLGGEILLGNGPRV